MNAAGLAGLQTVVVFVRAGKEIARTVVPGHLLEFDVPRSVQLRRARGFVELIEDPDPLLECCGELQLPWVSRDGPGVTSLEVSAPAPFGGNDLRTMWLARNRLSSRRRPPTSGVAEWSRLELLLGRDVDWVALQDAVRSAATLLASWPTRPVPEAVWLPVDRSGGRLLVGVTERSARSHCLPGLGRSAPALTARRTSVKQERQLQALSAVSSLLASAVAEVAGIEAEPDLRDRLVNLFRRVSAHSRPHRPTADPPASAWPAAFTCVYSNCLRALSTVRNLGPGAEKAPLSELWELYQAWVADAVMTAISETLGEPMLGYAERTCLGRWRDGSGVVELHYQPTVPAVGHFGALGQSFIAVVGDLEPDLLLLRSAHNGTTRALVIDAKKRSASIGGDDLTMNVSKYLWGIRAETASNKAPAIDGCILLAPMGGEASARPEGRADVATAHPSAGLEPLLVPVLLDVLRGVSSAFPDRSGWHAAWH